MSAAQAASSREEATAEVSPSPTMEPALFEGPTRIKVVCAELLWVRESPMGERVGYVRGGQLLEVFEPVNGWSEIAAGKWRGLWVRESWLCR